MVSHLVVPLNQQLELLNFKNDNILNIYTNSNGVGGGLSFGMSAAGAKQTSKVYALSVVVPWCDQHEGRVEVSMLQRVSNEEDDNNL